MNIGYRLFRLEQLIARKKQDSQLKLWVAWIDCGVLRGEWADPDVYYKWHPEEQGQVSHRTNCGSGRSGIEYETAIGRPCWSCECPWHGKENQILDAKGMLKSRDFGLSPNLDELIASLTETP